MSPKALQILNDAKLFVSYELLNRTPPETIIAAMVEHFGARRWDSGYSGYKLRCGTVTASSTSNPHESLLGAWQRLAERHLLREIAARRSLERLA